MTTGPTTRTDFAPRIRTVTVVSNVAWTAALVLLFLAVIIEGIN